MNILFKDMTAGAVVYALVKGDELKYTEGAIVSVSQPRVNMPKYEAGQVPMQMPAVQNVVDVTYSLDGQNYTDVVDVTASMFPTKNPGALTLVSTDKEAIVRELHATLKSSENYLKEAEREVPKQKKRITDCKALIAQLDTNFQERQQTEERFAKIEEAQKQQGDKLDEIIDMMKKIVS
jgi:hypothetical protein